MSATSVDTLNLRPWKKLQPPQPHPVDLTGSSHNQSTAAGSSKRPDHAHDHDQAKRPRTTRGNDDDDVKLVSADGMLDLKPKPCDDAPFKTKTETNTDGSTTEEQEYETSL